MARIYETIRNAVTSKMIKSAASTLSEDESKVSSAVKILIPSQLAAMLKNGENQHTTDIVRDAGKLKIYSKKEQLFEGSGVVDGINVGERFENALVGVQNSEFPQAVAVESGISHESADRLSNWTAGLIAGFFGDKMIKEKRSMSSLMSELAQEKSALMADIPPRVAEKLNLSVCNVGSEKNHPACDKKKTKNGGYGWIWWLIIALIVILIIIFAMRSCNRRNEVRNANANTATSTERVESIQRQTDNAANRERSTITLTNGRTITVYKGGVEEQMVDFLNSDRYRNASAQDLRNTWYHFDDIDFVYDSADQLTPGSMTQLQNLAEILKNYPDVKIKIGGYADNKGGNAVNNEISEQRANYIQSVFVQNGIDAARVSTEGFGKEFATVPADASDAARAIDRSIALRLDK